MSNEEVEHVAKFLRKEIRKKVGLQLDWDKASDKLKEWYRRKAREHLNEPENWEPKNV